MNRQIVFVILAMLAIAGAALYMTRKPVDPDAAMQELLAKPVVINSTSDVPGAAKEESTGPAAATGGPLDPVKVLEGHADGVMQVVFSPDGKQLASASADHTVGLWDVEKGSLIKKLEGHTQTVSSVSFSPDGKKLLTGSWDRTALIWDVATGTVEAKLAHTDKVLKAAYLPDGKHVVTAANDVVTIWDVAGEKMVGQGTADGEVASMAVSPTGDIATGDWGGAVIVWNPATGKQRLHKAHMGGELTRGINVVLGVAFAGPEKMQVSDVFGLWEWDMKDTFTQVAANAGAAGLVISPDKSLGASTMGFVGDFEHANWVSLRREKNIGTAAFDPTGKYFAVGTCGITMIGSYKSEGPGQINIYEVNGLKNVVAAGAKGLGARDPRQGLSKVPPGVEWK